jgi:ATP phosphoribosyltransferase regulatory subunit
MLAEPRIAPARLAAIRAPFEAFAARRGGRWTDAPALLPLSLMLDLAGEGMRARLFDVAGEGAEPLCLRPDFTIPIAAAHIEGGTREGRYLYEGNAFRTAPRGSGRPVEFLQVGAEIHGPADDAVAQDAEIAALAWAAARAGGRDDLGLVLGDVGLFDAFLAAVDVAPAARAGLVRAFASGRGVRRQLSPADAPSTVRSGGRLAELLSALPEEDATGVLEELWRLAGISPVGGRSPAEIVHRLAARDAHADATRLGPAQIALVDRYLAILAAPRSALEQVAALVREAGADISAPLSDWARRLDLLTDAGAPEGLMVLSTGFVRPFGYYDGMFFEVRSLALGFDRPVAAGGRYDALPARLGGATTGAVGCMVRPGRAVLESAR